MEAAFVFPVFVCLWLPLLYLIRCCVLYEVISETAYAIAETTAESSAFFDKLLITGIQQEVWQDTGYEETVLEGHAVVSELLQSTLGQDPSFLLGLAGYLERVVDFSGEGGGSVGGELWKAAINGTGSLIVSEMVDRLLPRLLWQRYGLSEVSTAYSEFYFQKDGQDQLVGIILTVPIHWPDPLGFFNDRNMVVSACARGFLGNVPQQTVVKPPQKDPGEEEQTVYYRIGNGKKAHLLSCFLITKELRQISAASAQQNGMQACEICGGNGLNVWISSGGEKYHSYGCRLLFPNLTPISEEELRSGQYAPCAICIGGGDWFTH